MDGVERAEIWLELIAEQEASGLSIAAWCRDAGVNPATMYWWRSELKRRARATMGSGGPAFVRVRVAGEATGRRDSGLRLIVGGREVLVEADFDERVLIQLVQCLERLAC